jgi:hypothetical protein
LALDFALYLKIKQNIDTTATHHGTLYVGVAMARTRDSEWGIGTMAGQVRVGRRVGRIDWARGS